MVLVINCFGSATLRSFHIADNKLSQLPADIGKLVLLETLVLRDNNIQHLPIEIGKLTALKYLLVQGNQLVTLPKELSSTALASSPDATFRVGGNPMAEEITLMLETRGLMGLFELMRLPNYEDALHSAFIAKKQAIEQAAELAKPGSGALRRKVGTKINK